MSVRPGDGPGQGTVYDLNNIRVRPGDLYALASAIENVSLSLSGHAIAILKSLASLTGTGWDSDSADLVTSFTHELAASFDDVFGTDGSDLRSGSSAATAGVLPAYVTYLKAAADAFDAADVDLAKSWGTFLEALAAKGGGNPLAGMGPAPGAVVGGGAVKPLTTPVTVHKSRP